MNIIAIVLMILLPGWLFSQTKMKQKKSINTVKLSAGTAIVAEANQDLSSETTTVGNIVSFKMHDNLILSQKTVIAKDAMVFGKIRTIRKTTYNRPECIQIELQMIKAIDGQMINLYGGYIEVLAESPGMNAKMEKGKLGIAYVQDTIIIQVY